MMLIDTSGLLCLYHRSEPFHERACAAYATAGQRLTHDYVLAEFVALANARRLPRTAALEFAIDLIDNPDIETVWVDELLHREAMSLLQARSDKSYSLADAVSFVLMRQNDLDEALTTDHHFEQEGFRRLLG
jgi:predicted nucleic acid-binding protein